jgi:hypothetical protein
MTKADVELRALLAAATDDGRTPRETRFFFYGGEFIALAAAAGRAGYEVAFMHITAPEVGVKLTITTAVDEQTFTPLVEQMYAWQEEFGCDYDGWECDLTPSNWDIANRFREEFSRGATVTTYPDEWVLAEKSLSKPS